MREEEKEKKRACIEDRGEEVTDRGMSARFER